MLLNGSATVIRSLHLSAAPSPAVSNSRAASEFENGAQHECILHRTKRLEAIERLEGAGVANARMRTVRQFLDHPQLEARDRWREFGSPVGPLRGLLPPATLAGTEPVMASIPEVGEHNEKLLAELGYEETTAPGRDGATWGGD